MILVKTTGKFMLVTPDGGEIPSKRPAVTERSSFVQERILLGQLELVTELPAGANDKDFAAILTAMGGNVEAAVEAYKAELLGVDPDVEAKRLAKEAADKAAAEDKAKAAAGPAVAEKVRGRR